MQVKIGSVWEIECVGIELTIEGTTSDTCVVAVFAPIKEEVGVMLLVDGF